MMGLRVGSELGKMCQSSSAELLSSSAILKVWPPDPWVHLRFFQSLKRPDVFHNEIKLLFAFIFFAVSFSSFLLH